MHVTDGDVRRRIGRAIATRRQAMNISQEVLALRMKTSQGAVSRIERGGAPATVTMMLRVAQAMGCEPWLLFAEALGSKEASAAAADLHALIRERPGVWSTVRLLVRRPVEDTVP
mgnify:CR=1 FL=1